MLFALEGTIVLLWFQRIARDGSGHRESVVVSEDAGGLRYVRCDEFGAQVAADATVVGALAAQAVAAFPWFTLALAVFALGSVALFYVTPWVAALAFSVAAAIGLFVLYSWQRRKKSVAIVYPRDSAIVQRKTAAIDTMLRALSSSSAAWILLNVGAVFDPRLATGMGLSVRRMPLRPWRGSPVPIESNLPLWSLDGPTARLVFLPDQLLVIAEGRVASFFYSELRANFSNAEFVETEYAMPRDATVLSWRAVHNKQDGTPDRRYKQQQWPACSYSHLQLIAPNGVTLEIIASRADIAAGFASLWPSLQEPSSAALRGYVSAPQQWSPPSVQVPPPSAQPGYPVLGPLPPVQMSSAPTNAPVLAGLPPPPVMPPIAATYAASANAASSPAEQPNVFVYTLHAGDEPAPFDPHELAPVALLRYIAVADRRFTDDEREYIVRNAAALCAISPDRVEKMLPFCPASENDVRVCATAVLARGGAFVDAMLVLLDQLPLIDGKATPNELVRLAQVRGWLGR